MSRPALGPLPGCSCRHDTFPVRSTKENSGASLGNSSRRAPSSSDQHATCFAAAGWRLSAPFRLLRHHSRHREKGWLPALADLRMWRAAAVGLIVIFGGGALMMRFGAGFLGGVRQIESSRFASWPVTSRGKESSVRSRIRPPRDNVMRRG